MGKMKELAIEQQEKAAHEEAQELSAMESSILNERRPFTKINATECPNCNLHTLMTNDIDISCEACGQAFIYINNSLRFK
jgi:hypothetical protein